MKISKNFIDCVYEPNQNGVNLDKIRYELCRYLPTLLLVELANIFAVETNTGLFVIKIRMCIQKSDGSVDIEKIHNKILESDFIEMDGSDYSHAKDLIEINQITHENIKPGSNVIFKMKDLDINMDSGEITNSKSKSIDDLLELFSDSVSSSDVLYAKLKARIFSFIVHERIKRQMTQEEFAKFIHIPESHLQCIECGDYDISLKELCEILSYLNKDIYVSFI